MISATAYDRVGNSSSSAQVTVFGYVDNPPTVSYTVTTPPGDLFSGMEFHVSGTANDDHGVALVELLVNGQTVLSNARTTINWTAAAPAGVSTVTINVRVTDTAGQITLGTPKSFTVHPTQAYTAIPLAGFANDIVVQDTYAYIAAGPAGVQIVDVHDPTAPFVIATLPTGGTARKLDVKGPYLFVANGIAGLTIVNVGQPAAPQIIATFATAGTALDVSWRNNRVYVGTTVGVEIVDITDPHVPRSVSRVAPTLQVESVAAKDGGVLMVTNDYLNPSCGTCKVLASLDLSNEQNPVIRSGAEISAGDYANVTYFNNRAYVSGHSEFYVLNAIGSFVSVVGHTDVNDTHNSYVESKISGNTAVIASSEAGLDSEMMVQVGSPNSAMGTSGKIDFSAFGPYNGTGIAIGPEIAYSTGIDHRVDLVTVDSSTVNSKLFIGRYWPRVDAGSAAPQVSIVTPVTGTSAVAGQALPIRVTATDDVAVKSVSIAVNGQTVAQTTVAPYEIEYDIPPGGGTLVITATATDFANLSTTSAPVTVNVAADTTPPAITLTSPAPGRSLLSSTVHFAASVTDNASVRTVSFLVNGVVVATTAQAPFNADYQVPAGMTAITVVVQATDASGNTAQTAPMTFSVFAPQPLAAFAIPGGANAVDVNGALAYVAANAGGLQIVDITDPTAPKIIGSGATNYPAMDVRVLGRYAYVTAVQSTYVSELEIFDVSTPTAPSLVATTPNAWRVSVSRTYAYTLDGGTQAAEIRDISHPASIGYLGLVTHGMDALDAQDEHIVLGYGTRASQIIAYDFGTALATLQLQSASWFSDRANDMRIKSGYVTAAYNSGLYVTSYDDRLAWYAQHSDGNPRYGVDFYDDVLATVGEGTTAALYDIFQRRQPVLRNAFIFDGWGALQRVVLTPTLLLGTRSDGYLFIMRYRTITDTAGVAPTVSVSATTDLRTGLLCNLRATATDDVGVASVTFTVNGVDVFTDTVAPFEYNYLAPAAGTTLTSTARATDLGGTVRTSTPLVMTVQP